MRALPGVLTYTVDLLQVYRPIPLNHHWNHPHLNEAFVQLLLRLEFQFAILVGAQDLHAILLNLIVAANTHHHPKMTWSMILKGMLIT